MSDFFTNRTLTARKNHECCACETDIRPGETYLRMSSVDDGRFFTSAYHPECRGAEIWENHLAGAQDDEWMWLWECVDEGGHAETFPSPVRERLMLRARRRADREAASVHEHFTMVPRWEDDGGFSPQAIEVRHG